MSFRPGKLGRARSCSIEYGTPFECATYSRRTENTYVHWIRRFIVFHNKKHPETMGTSEIAAFLSWLATSQRVRASTQNQALSALLFLYRHVLRIEIGTIEQVARAKMPHRVPVVLSQEEVGKILKNLDGTMWIVVALLDGAGLRLQECLELRVKDLDFDRHEIVVRRGKGQKDRRTMLPTGIGERLRAHLRNVKRQHDQDLARFRAGGAALCAGSHPTLRQTGDGSLCFPPVVFVAIHGGARRRGFTFTNRSCSGRLRTRRARLVSRRELGPTR